MDLAFDVLASRPYIMKTASTATSNADDDRSEGEHGEKDSLVEDILAGARGEKTVASHGDEEGVRVDFGAGNKERLTASPVGRTEEDEGLA